MPAIKIDASTISSEKLIDSESLNKLKSFSSISEILNIKAPDKSELRNLEDSFNMTRTNIKNTISNAETLMNYMSDIVADAITFKESFYINEFVSSTWKMTYKKDQLVETIFESNNSFLDEITNLAGQFESILNKIKNDVKDTNSGLRDIENVEVAFSNFAMSHRIDDLNDMSAQFESLVSLIADNEKTFSDVNGTLMATLEEQTNNANTSKADEVISVMNEAIELLTALSGNKAAHWYKGLFHEFYYIMQFIKDFIDHDRAMLYLFFMYRVGNDNKLFDKIFLSDNSGDNYPGINDLIDKIFKYGNDNEYRGADGDYTYDEAISIAESKSKILSRFKDYTDSNVGVDVRKLLKQKIKNTLDEINNLNKEHYDSVKTRKAAVVMIRMLLTSNGDFNLFDFKYSSDAYGQSEESFENDINTAEIIAAGGLIGLTGVAVTTGVMATVGWVWLAGTIAVGAVALPIVAAAAVVAGLVALFDDREDQVKKRSKTIFHTERRKIRIDGGKYDDRDPALRFKLIKHTEQINKFKDVFYGEDSLKIGKFFRTTPTRNDLFALLLADPMIMYVKNKNLQLLTKRMKNYKEAVKAIRDIADTSETTSNFTTFREILGENGNNLIYCKNRLSDLNASSKYNFINNRQTLTNENEILGINSLFSQAPLLKENSNENLKILSFAINSSLLKKFDNNDLNIIKMTITKTDKININDSFDPVIILLDLAMFPTFKSEITSTPSTFSEYVKNNIEFKKYNDQYIEETMNYARTKGHMMTIGLTGTTADNMLALSVSSLILEKYLKYLVGFNFDYLDVIDNNISTDEGSEEIFNKILEENKLTESDETVSRLKKLLFEKSTLFNSKKIEYETLAQNEIVKTFHVMLNIKDDFPRQKKHMLDFDYNVNRALNSYEFEVTYEALPNETEFSSVALSTISLLDSLA